MVVDGGTSFEFNDGAIATISLHKEDLLKTVLLDDWTHDCSLVLELHQVWTWDDHWQVKNGLLPQPEGSSSVIDEAKMNWYFYSFAGRIRILLRCWHEIPAGCPTKKLIVSGVLAQTECHAFCCHYSLLRRKLSKAACRTIHFALLDYCHANVNTIRIHAALNIQGCMIMVISLQYFYFYNTWCIFQYLMMTKHYSQVIV